MRKNKQLLLMAALAASAGSYAQITGVPEAGSYYFKDVASGKFLGGANNWGTQASLKDHGIIIKVAKPNGKYTLDTNTFNGDKHFFDGGYIDGASTDFEITETATAGEYTLKVGDKYIATSGSIVANSESDVAKAAKWQLIPVSDLLAKFATASFDSPADATFLIKGGDFSRNWAENSAWQGSPSFGSINEEEYRENINAEKWNTNFDIYQDITGVPQGLYKLTAQAFYRAGDIGAAATAHNNQTEAKNALLYANDKSIPLKSIFAEATAAADGAKGMNTASDAGYIPNSMREASKAFSAGLYKSDPVYVYVGSEGTLRVGVKKSTTIQYDWAIFDNFELAYIGDINVEAVRLELINKLAVYITKAGRYTDDATLQSLANDASALMAKINQLVETNPNAYEQVANYLSGVKGNLGEQIEELGAKITQAAANYDAYVYAMQTDGKGYKALKAAQDHLQGVYDNAQPATKEAAKDMLASAKKLVTDFETGVKEAYEAGNAGTIYPSATVDEQVTNIIASLQQTETAIQSGSTDALSYTNVKNKITEAKAAYSNFANSIYGHLVENAPVSEKKADGNYIYNDLYVEALSRPNTGLGAYMRQINAVEEQNEAKHAAEACNEATQTEFTTTLQGIIGKMEAVVTEYKDRVDGLRDNYTAACGAVEGLTNSLKTQVEDVIGDRADVKDFYKANVASIKESIKALQDDVDAANEDHSIKGSAPYCTGYTDKSGAITTAIGKLKTKVAKSVAEHNANAATVAAIGVVETSYKASKEGKGKKDSNDFDDNFIGVDNMKSADKAYSTKGVFEASEKSITDAIAALKAAAAAAYKVDGSGKAGEFERDLDVDVDENTTRKGLNTINDEIAQYRANAAQAISTYNTVATAITTYNDKLNGTPAVGEEGQDGYVAATPGLVGTATNKEVTVDAAALADAGKTGADVLTGDSYSKAITGFSARITAIQDALAAAIAKADVEELNALKAIDTDDNLDDEIDNLTGLYPNNQTAWNVAQLAAAKDLMLAEADRRYKDVNDDLPDAYTTTDYGKAATDLNKDRGDIVTALQNISDGITEARNGSDDAAAIAKLSEVVTALADVETLYTNLTTKATAAWEAYDAEKTAKKALEESISEVRALLNGGSFKNVDYPALSTKLAPAASNYFNTEISNLNTRINNVETKLGTSFTNETVVKDAANSKDDQQKDVLGYTDLLVNIKTAISNLSGLAVNESENATSKNTIDGKVADAKLATDVYDDVKAKLQDDTEGKVIATGAARTYYVAQLDLLVKTNGKNFQKLLSDITAANNAKVKSDLDGALPDNQKYTDTSKNVKNKLSTFQGTLAELVTSVTDLPTLAKANEDAHNTQTAAYNETLTSWNTLFATVTSAEASDAHAAALETLTAAKKDLNKYYEDITTAFGKGECDTKKAAFLQQITAVNTTISDLAGSWAKTYDEAITADNLKRWNSFQTAYATLTDTYSENVQLIYKLSKLSYASGVINTLNEITEDNSERPGVYTYATLIPKLYSDAKAAYDATVNSEETDLFDADETFKAMAGTYGTSISNLTKNYSDAVSGQADATYTSARGSVESKFNTAKNAIKNTLGYDDDQAAEAIKDVKAILANAKTKREQAADFAILLDTEILPAFDTVDVLLADDKEEAAKTTWNSLISNATTLAQDELADMGKFLPGDEASVTARVDDYNDFVENYITAAAEAWAEVGEGDKFAEFTNCKSILDVFIAISSGPDGTSVRDLGTEQPNEVKHTNKYWAAYDIDKAKRDNNTAYGKMLEAIAALEEAYNETDDYVTSLYIQNNAGLQSSLNYVANCIINYKNRAERYLNQGTAEIWLNTIETNCGNLSNNNLNNIINGAIDAEKAAMNVQIGQLRTDYANAAAINLENEDLPRYKTTIDGFEALNVSIYKDYTEGKEKLQGELLVRDPENKATAAETQAAYIALEKAIGETKADLTEKFNSAAAETAKNNVQNKINELQSTYETLVGLTAPEVCHQVVIDKYQRRIEALEAAIEAAQAKLDQEVLEKTVLLYAENNIANIDDIAALYDGMDEDIAADEALYDTHDTNVAELNGIIDALSGKLSAVKTKADGFEYYETDYSGSWQVGDEVYNDNREYKNAEIAAQIASVKGIVASITAPYCDDYAADWYKRQLDVIDGNIQGMDRDLSYYNATQTINVVYGYSAWRNAVNQLNSYHNAGRLTDNDYTELNAEVSTLYNNWAYLNSYNNNAINGYVWYDLDGKSIETVDDDQNPIYGEAVNYLEKYTAIMARAEELKEAIAAYTKEVDAKSFMKGDVNHDKKVNVADYSAVRNIALGFTEADPTSAIFYAADVNNDKEITVGDVTAIANYIMYNYWPAGAGSRSAVKNRDAISVAMTANNGKQQVVISLNNKFEYVAAQMDIQLPAGMKLVGESLTSRANGHELLSNDVNGAHRVLISTLANSAFLNNETALVVLDVEVTDEYQGGMIQVNNAIFADASAHAYKLADVATGETTGIDALTVDVKNATIYDFSGRRVFNVKKGNFYIINGKSVLVK